MFSIVTQEFRLYLDMLMVKINSMIDIKLMIIILNIQMMK